MDSRMGGRDPAQKEESAVFILLVPPRRRVNTLCRKKVDTPLQTFVTDQYTEENF